MKKDLAKIVFFTNKLLSFLNVKKKKMVTDCVQFQFPHVFKSCLPTDKTKKQTNK